MDPFASSTHHPLRAPEHARCSDVARARAERAAGRLAENVVHFARALRAAGIPVGPGAVMDALAAVEVAGVRMREDFYWTLHAVLVKRHEHSLIFDQAFRIFFRRRGMLDTLLATMLPQAPARSEEHTSELQSLRHLVCRLLLEKKKQKELTITIEHT